MYNKTRTEEVEMLKKLWNEEDVICPKCREEVLVLLHKKKKKSNNDWVCPKCGEIYRTISMLLNLPEK